MLTNSTFVLVNCPCVSIHTPALSKPQYEIVFFNSSFTNSRGSSRSNSVVTEVVFVIEVVLAVVDVVMLSAVLVEVNVFSYQQQPPPAYR